MPHGREPQRGDENAHYSAKDVVRRGLLKADNRLALSARVNVVRTLFAVGCAWHNGLSPPPRGGEHEKEC